jgi:hypothetical protein
MRDRGHRSGFMAIQRAADSCAPIQPGKIPGDSSPTDRLNALELGALFQKFNATEGEPPGSSAAAPGADQGQPR